MAVSSLFPSAYDKRSERMLRGAALPEEGRREYSNANSSLFSNTGETTRAATDNRILTLKAVHTINARPPVPMPSSSLPSPLMAEGKMEHTVSFNGPSRMTQ